MSKKAKSVQPSGKLARDAGWDDILIARPERAAKKAPKAKPSKKAKKRGK